MPSHDQPPASMSRLFTLAVNKAINGTEVQVLGALLNCLHPPTPMPSKSEEYKSRLPIIMIMITIIILITTTIIKNNNKNNINSIINMNNNKIAIITCFQSGH
jgi:hypothetical protein